MFVRVMVTPTLSMALLAKSVLEAAGLRARDSGQFSDGWVDQPFYVEVPDDEIAEARDLLIENGWERQLL